MKKELKYYVPFYLGCECITPDGIMVLNGINTTDVRYSVWFYCKWSDKKNCYLPKQNGEILGKQSLVGKAYKYSDIKLVLRSLSDMTEKEAKEMDLSDVQKGLLAFGHKLQMYMTPNQFNSCLKNHFDLFGLIESGLAVNAAELKSVSSR